MPADYIETRDVPLDELTRYPGNPRRGDVDRIRASVRRNGQYRALVVRDTGGALVILAGNHTAAALDAEGIPRARCEIVKCDDTTAARINLADNRTGEVGSYDDVALGALLAMFAEDGEGTGWTDDEISDLLTPPDTDVDEDPDGDGDAADAVPDLPEVAYSRTGDLWLLGEHRVICGDATQPGSVALLLDGVRPDMTLTDPPYCSGGFQESGRAAGSIGTRREGGIIPTIANDRLSTRGYMALMKSVLDVVQTPIVYMFTDWRMWVNLFDVAESSGLSVRQMIVWNKGTPGMGIGWRSQHELVMLATRATIKWDNHKAQGNVVSVSRTGNPLHPTQKPVELLRDILNITDMAGTVYDPFGGSGSTLIAAHDAGRVAYCSDLDPKHVDTMARRFQEHTGIVPVLERDGRRREVDLAEVDTDVEPVAAP